MSNLPELPKKRAHKEADFGLKFRKWIEANPMPVTTWLEHKSSRGHDSMLFSEVKDIQIINALKAKGKKGILVRIEKGTTGAPDYAWFRNCPSYIVISYPKGFVLIDIEVFVEEKRINTRRSLSYSRATEICHLHV